MDELTQVRDHVNQIEGASPDTERAARAALQERIGEELHTTGSHDGPARPSVGSRVPRRALTIAAAVMVLMLGTVGVFAAGGYFGEDVPDSPWITVNEAAHAVPELADGIPVPDGRDFSGRETLYRDLAARDAEDTGEAGRVQVAGARETLARDATCMWMDEWWRAAQSGDVRTADRALHVIEAASGWPHWTINNEQTMTTHLDRLANAAREGDADTIQTELSTNCPPYTSTSQQP